MGITWRSITNTLLLMYVYCSVLLGLIENYAFKKHVGITRFGIKKNDTTICDTTLKIHSFSKLHNGYIVTKNPFAATATKGFFMVKESSINNRKYPLGLVFSLHHIVLSHQHLLFSHLLLHNMCKAYQKFLSW